MDGSDAQILCGEWETGDVPSNSSGERYNVVLPIEEIVRHPDFDTGPNAGPGAGNDIAVFKVKDAGLRNSRSLRIYPACLPSNERSTPVSGVHSGWSKPPPFHFLEKNAEGFIRFYSDFFKQWHYQMNILPKCEDPKVSQTFGANLTSPSNSFYPPGTICATDFTLQSCFSTGDSGSPLMVKENAKYYIEGIQSFVKGCDTFSFGAINDERTEFQLGQMSTNPSTYTKLSCFLPWVAEQYGLSYDGDTTDESCRMGTGQKETTEPCRETVSNLLGKELECIFPFYYEGKLYDECILLQEDGFVYPVFRCPVRNITTKINGINSYQFQETTQGLCCKNMTCDPNDTTCPDTCRLPMLSQCKNDCPGGRCLMGIISKLSYTNIFSPQLWYHWWRSYCSYSGLSRWSGSPSWNRYLNYPHYQSSPPGGIGGMAVVGGGAMAAMNCMFPGLCRT